MTDTATQEVPVFTDVTPSGLEIEYVPHPRRYRIRKPPDTPLVEAVGTFGTKFDWVEVPSVSTVLGVLDKPGLPYWGNKVGVDGVLELVSRGLLVWVP